MTVVCPRGRTMKDGEDHGDTAVLSEESVQDADSDAEDVFELGACKACDV